MYGIGRDPLVDSTSYPPFITADGVLYSVIEFNDYAELPERYIEIDTIKVMKCGKNYIVNARGSSVFSNGKVQEPDSDVKILINENHRVISVQAIHDHIGSLNTEYESEFEKIKATVERYCSIKDIIETINEEKVKIIKNRYTNLLQENRRFYLCESDIFRSFTDLYDWYTSLCIDSSSFAPSPIKEFCHWYMGNYSTWEYSYAPLFAYTEDGLMVTVREFDIVKDLLSIPIPSLSEDFFDKCELKVEKGQIIFIYESEKYDEEHGGYPHEEIRLERVDEFGDGNYSYKIPPRVFG